MKINSIILENFRNYNMLECFPDPKLNIIVGENAQGKTNLIEAIYISAFAKSFRTNRSQEMIKFGAERARVHLDVTSEELEHSINIVLLNDGKKKITKDGKGIRKATELLNTVVVVVFSPEDLRIIKDSPEKRRNFINRELSQIRPAYYEALRSYGEALKQKNALIKGYFNIRKKTFTRADNLILNESSNVGNNEGNNIYDNSRQFNEDMLDVYDQQLAASGYEIIRYRTEFIEMLSLEASEIMKKVSGGKENLEIAYKTRCNYKIGPDGRDVLYRQISANRKRDIYSGNSGIGPHRDDIEFYINGEDARKYGSQGQQRTIALSLKLAEIRIINQMLGESPILLLDDVLSELDADRQRFLISEIEDVQLFITAAEISEYVIDALKGGILLKVDSGSITKINEKTRNRSKF